MITMYVKFISVLRLPPYSIKWPSLSMLSWSTINI